MKQKADDEQKVSEFYQSYSQKDDTVTPPFSVDQKIRQAAFNAVKKKTFSFSKFSVPVSIAAGFIMASAVIISLSTDTSSSNSAGVQELKTPMFLLQRSKPASAEIMLQQLDQLIEQRRIDQARIFYRKFQTYFPEQEPGPELKRKLQAENII